MAESLSEKIAGILNTAPATFDPEDDVDEETTARVEHQYEKENSENEDEISQSLSQFRKQNVELLEEVDKRYDGKRASRKKLLQHDEWETESENEESEQESDGEGSESSITEESSNEESDEEKYGSLDELGDLNTTGDPNVFSKSEHTSKAQRKSSCVRQQLNIWENLLEMRIQLQKCLLTANKMPQSSHFREIKNASNPDFGNTLNKTTGNMKCLLDKFLLLQELLLKNYPETKQILSKGSKETPEIDEEIPSDTDQEQSEDEDDAPCKKKMKLNEYNAELNRRFHLYHNYRNQVLQKWHDKTQIGVNKSNNVVHSVTEQIGHVLSNKEKLIKATQLKRSHYEILGEKEPLPNNNNALGQESKVSNDDVHNVNIYDDTDFYHHLLRELIEFKSADLTDPVKLGRQWTQLQHLRSKMKKKVDTKATKGRKIRYVVHSKLVNFMAPIQDSTWQEGAKNELYNSLFGKNQPIKTIT